MPISPRAPTVRPPRSNVKVSGAVACCLAVLACVAGAAPAAADGALDAYLPKSGTIKGHVVELGVAKQDQAISKQFKSAVMNNMDWFRHYMLANKAGEPLPYNPKMGVTEAQYDELLHMKADLKETAPTEISVRRGADGAIAFASADPLAAALQGTSFPADEKVAETPFGKLAILNIIHQQDTNAPFGKWVGAEWARVAEDGSDQPSVKIAFGKRDPSGEGVMYYQVAPTKDKPEQNLAITYKLD